MAYGRFGTNTTRFDTNTSQYLTIRAGCDVTPPKALAVNDMLLMSFEGFLRFFPVWPTADDVSFTQLRVRCAFSNRYLHSRMPLSFTPLLRLKRADV
jgi:hypothetical protein